MAFPFGNSGKNQLDVGSDRLIFPRYEGFRDMFPDYAQLETIFEITGSGEGYGNVFSNIDGNVKYVGRINFDECDLVGVANFLDTNNPDINVYNGRGFDYVVKGFMLLDKGNAKLFNFSLDKIQSKRKNSVGMSN